MRLAACMDVPLDIIEPAGFVLSDARLRRSGMDYLDALDLTRHVNWEAFCAANSQRRLVLLSTRGTDPLHKFAFSPEDTLLLGRESSGVPDHVHGHCAARLYIPMRPALRSLNVAVAGALAIGEALRQTGRLEAFASAQKLEDTK